MKIGLRNAVLVLAAIVLVGFGVGIVLLAQSGDLGGTFRGESRTVDLDRTESFSGVQSLEVGTTETEIRVHKTTDSRIRFHLHGQANNPPELRISNEYGYLRATVERKRRTGLFLFGFRYLVLDVYLPGKIPGINLHSVSGGVVIDALETDELRLKTVSGRLSGEKIKTMKTSAETTSGGLGLSGILGDLNGKTVSGGLNLAYEAYSGQMIYLKSVSGGVKLDLPPGASFALNAHSVSGGISCAFPIMATGERRKTLAGKVGDGGSAVEIGTVSGGIKIY